MEERLFTSTRNPVEGSEESTLRPRAIQDYVGQEKIKSNLMIFIEAAKLRGESLDHLLLYGPPGLGKTTLAHIVANALN